MLHRETAFLVLWLGLVPGPWLLQVYAADAPIVTRTNVVIRVLSSNLTGNSQKYEAPALRILTALRPDVVAMQEFNYVNNTPADFRAMIDTTLGSDFAYFRETGYSIPNGIISRFPLRAAGSWDDLEIPDRGFAWAQLDIPGDHDLFVVSVHLKASSSDANTRLREAARIRELVQANFPAGAFVVIAGDLNFQNRSETALATLSAIVTDDPIPTDAESGGDPDTNNPRSRPYDYVLPSHALRTNLVAAVVGGRSFANGLVFDSRVFTPLSAVPSVQSTDSGTAQHMAVLKDFRIEYAITNYVTVPPPYLVIDGVDAVRWQGIAGVTYTVDASGDLIDWDTIGFADSSDTNFQFRLPESAGRTRFFRVKY